MRWWWLVGWAFPNLAHRHYLIERADRARHTDLPWYGLPPDVDAQRSLGGMAGHYTGRRGGEVHAVTTTLHHGRPAGAFLQVSVQRHATAGGTQPLARLALPLIRDRLTDPRWAAHSPQQLRQRQAEALAELTPERVDFVVDGAARRGEVVRVEENWAALITLPGETFDLELRGHSWSTDNLAVCVVRDIGPYLAGSRALVGPLLVPRRLRLRR
jgi:hypothetical protein